MFVSTGLLALLCLSCADRDPLSPHGAAALFQLGAASHEEGCARFQVELSGQDGVEIKGAGAETCGTLVPVIAGAPTFDRTKRLVRLPVALENRAQRKVKAPAWLLGWEDSLAVVSPAGLAANRHAQRYLAWESADSVTPAEDTVLHGARIWKYDEILADSAEVQTLGPGKRSRVRWINVSVHPGVESFNMLLHGRAERAGLPVPPVPPRGFTIPMEQVQALYATDSLIVRTPADVGAVSAQRCHGRFSPDGSAAGAPGGR
jgi:hypothetical protein